MHLLEILKRASPAERREIGEIFTHFSDAGDEAEVRATLDMVMNRYADPRDQSLKAIWADMQERVQSSRKRVHALSDGLRADGMGHEQLIEAELKRRSDGRTVKEYCIAVCDGSSVPDSDVTVRDVFS
ncbi:hypothetical protein [Novosphingobium sp. CECT 9465]|uniref:hypothetical protein n=1 Tax=Novosphingobium sp. CECT 9465 TaxID=2829794 RepID=UPI001E56C55A|nr:hypothetical protein [Novosphingobium sp. CECT 9465]CAH0496613.1 hypothetical protein NVSP9465_01650 [Novosphingobium sp. CECT 9465]